MISRCSRIVWRRGINSLTRAQVSQITLSSFFGRNHARPATPYTISHFRTFSTLKIQTDIDSLKKRVGELDLDAVTREDIVNLICEINSFCEQSTCTGEAKYLLANMYMFAEALKRKEEDPNSGNSSSGRDAHSAREVMREIKNVQKKAASIRNAKSSAKSDDIFALSAESLNNAAMKALDESASAGFADAMVLRANEFCRRGNVLIQSEATAAVDDSRNPEQQQQQLKHLEGRSSALECYRQAVALYEKAISMNPPHTDALYNLASMYQEGFPGAVECDRSDSIVDDVYIINFCMSL